MACYLMNSRGFASRRYKPFEKMQGSRRLNLTLPTPTLPVASAMELIRSLIIMKEGRGGEMLENQPSSTDTAGAGGGAAQSGRISGVGGEGAVAFDADAALAATSSRFSDEEVKQAFEVLRACGWVSRIYGTEARGGGGGGRRVFASSHPPFPLRSSFTLWSAFRSIRPTAHCHCCCRPRCVRSS